MINVSVIIPYYKKIDYIEDTLNSVLNQKIKSFEIIIIFDDTDKSELYKLRSIIKKKKKREKIRLIINSKNLGAGLSRNRGIKASKGKYIAFLDADDVWSTNKLNFQLKFMKKFKYKISHTSYSIIDKKNNILGYRKAKFIQTYESLIKSCDIGLSSVIAKKELLLNNQFSSNKTKEDYILWLNIAKKNYIYGLNKNLLYWRKTKNSLSSSINQKIIDAFDIYYRKEKFNFFHSIYRVVILSFNYFLKTFK